jgi:hypothetical protein
MDWNLQREDKYEKQKKRLKFPAHSIFKIKYPGKVGS